MNDQDFREIQLLKRERALLLEAIKRELENLHWSRDANNWPGAREHYQCRIDVLNCTIEECRSSSEATPIGTSSSPKESS